MIGNELYAILCGPMSVIATVVNFVFILCLLYPAAGVSLRQPLQFLLTAMLCYSTVQQLTILVTVIIVFLNAPYWLQVVTKAVIYITYSSCFSSNAWISNFYYIKVVPHRWAVLVWIQKNVQAIVCGGFILDQIILITAMSTGATTYLLPQAPFNSTAILLNGMTNDAEKRLRTTLQNVCDMILTLYLIIPILTLTFSWGRTFIYLRGHMKQMAETTSTASRPSPQQKNQMRVTIMGIVQTALFLPSCLWTLFMVFTYSTIFLSIDGNRHITMTITSVSALANIVCLGYSQSVFRSTVGAKLNRLKKACALGSQNGND